MLMEIGWWMGALALPTALLVIIFLIAIGAPQRPEKEESPSLAEEWHDVGYRFRKIGAWVRSRWRGNSK